MKATAAAGGIQGDSGTHRTRYRVWQYGHVATPNRSMLCGGAPQFGHGVSIAPRGPGGAAAKGCIAGGGGSPGLSPVSAMAKTAPPPNIRPKPRSATRTGWTTPVTAAAVVPNMNTKNPVNTRPSPAAFAGRCAERTGRTYGTDCGNACPTRNESPLG